MRQQDAARQGGDHEMYMFTFTIFDFPWRETNCIPEEIWGKDGSLESNIAVSTILYYYMDGYFCHLLTCWSR